MLAQLRQFSRTLASVPSLVYALLYIGLIPSFAILYYCALRNDFYHSTAQFEYGPMNRAADHILLALRRSIVENFKAVQPNSACKTWNVDVDSLGASRLRTDDDAVTFSLYVRLRSGGVEEGVPLNLSFQFHPSISIWPNQGPAGRIDYFELITQHPYQPAFKGGLGSADLIACVFPAANGSNAAPGLLRIPGALTSEIVRFSEAKRGFPTQIEGQFVRMLYLSASTITTLGFGDIVPLTTPARVAVSVEAVTGILVMGLFLNAVAKER